MLSLHGENAYIAQDTVTGSTVWAEPSPGVNGANAGEGIVVTASGHVIENNTVSGWRDCISKMEDSQAVDQFSIDSLAYDFNVCADDAIKADFCFSNFRTVGNRMTNSFVAMSSQPSLRGPTYFVRTSAYTAVFNAFELNRGSVGEPHPRRHHRHAWRRVRRLHRCAILANRTSREVAGKADPAWADAATCHEPRPSGSVLVRCAGDAATRARDTLRDACVGRVDAVATAGGRRLALKTVPLRRVGAHCRRPSGSPFARVARRPVRRFASPSTAMRQWVQFGQRARPCASPELTGGGWAVRTPPRIAHAPIAASTLMNPAQRKTST